MTTRQSVRRFAGLLVSMMLACHLARAAGFRQGIAADPDGKPLVIGIWYPSHAAPTPLTLGPTTMDVALNGPVEGTGLPMVVMSHGNGGSFLGHVDTAIALADAGYVVAAVTHTGDNYADQSRAVYLMDRPRHISRLIDHMLTTWTDHAAIDPRRIGMFGFSSGGFTTLVSIGGVPDFAKVAPMCEAHPGDYACQLLSRSGKSVPTLVATGAADARIKAAVVVAPALGFAFSPDGLKGVTIPVQLWRAEDDQVLPQPRYAEAVRSALPRAPDYHVVPLAGHFDFLAPCNATFAARAPEICRSTPGFDRVAFHRAFDAAVVGFFDEHLKPR